ncbi:hypothetical protein [Phytohabitans rumicis]|uniref:Uncharacterized protein n=1 Tax=Phytohabitans rumicis TaxID=1076125 RepID=A0A6V8KYJ1_9ACTN|nr:hypothetical protein [Phytohabitans rumicis]GFJ86907.1 hypothetical protein Prum_005490 [Phytohabitans rumicis]
MHIWSRLQQPGRSSRGAQVAAQSPPALAGGGQSLDPATRSPTEGRFGWDFSRIKVHADSQTKPRVQRSGDGNLSRLNEMLDRLDVPEGEVIRLLGELTSTEKQTVLSDVSYRDRMVAALANSEMADAVDALGATLAVKLAWMAAEGTSYDLVKPRIQAAPAVERGAVLGDRVLLASLRDGLWWWDDFAKCMELLGRTAPDVTALIANSEVERVLETAWLKSNPGVRVVPVQKYIHEEGDGYI